jgi:hypothetical protein
MQLCILIILYVLGLRIRNVITDIRNLLIYADYMVFILTYHKSLNMINASRYPVRFLLSEVAELLLQFLILIQPFRIFLSKKTSIPEDISEYLWINGKKVWPSNKMIRILTESSSQIINIRITAQI